MTRDWDKQVVHDELNQAQDDFHRLLGKATPQDLARRTNGARWNNEQLLFHMLFGYMIIWALLGIARLLGRLPQPVSRAYARLLNSTTGPFNLVNYLGPCVAIHIYGHRRMGAKFDRVIASLHRRLDRQAVASLDLGVHYPTRWDPFFADYMTVADIYRYPTRPYGFHRRQLTLSLP